MNNVMFRATLVLAALSAPWLCAVASEGAPEKPRAAEWTQYRGEGATGVSPDASIKPPLKLMWSYRCDSDTSGDACAGSTVAEGKVFTNMAMQRSTLALDAGTGDYCWEYSHRDLDPHTASTCAEGKLFVWAAAYGRSTLVALDVATGKPIWEKPLKGSKGVAAGRFGAAYADGKILLADIDGAPQVIAFNAANGDEVWRANLGTADGTETVAPTVAGGKVFTGLRTPFERGGDRTGAVIALNLADGKELWRNKNTLPSRPVVSDGKIVVAKYNGEPALKKGNQKMYVLDAESGKELWSKPHWILYSTTSILPEMILQKNYGGLLIALNRADGKELWRTDLPTGSGCCSPSISGVWAYVGTGSYNDSEGIWAWRFDKPPHKDEKAEGKSWTFHALDLKTGKSEWRYVTGCNACGDPAIAYGKLYLNSRDGRVYCFAPVKEGEQASPESPDETPHAGPAEVKRALAAELAPPRPGKDWPMLGGTPRRTGLPVTLKPPLAPAWVLDTGGRVLTAAAIRDGKVYAGSLSGKIFCADLKSGKQEWAFDTGAEVQCAPAVADGTVYCGSDNGTFYALNAADGQPRWTYACGGPVQCAPAVAGDAVIFGANDHNVYVLNRRTGKKLWRFRTEYPLVLAPPVLEGDRIYAAQWVDWAYALDAASGKELWRTCVPITIEALQYHKDRLWLRSPRQFAEFDPATGKRLRLGNHFYGYNAMGFLDHFMITSGLGSAGIVDLNQKGKETRYAKDQPALAGVLEIGGKGFSISGRLETMGTPLVLGDSICLATRAGEVLLLQPDLATFGERYVKVEVGWAAKLGGTCHASPVASDGFLVVGCDDGKLYAFREAP